MNKVFVGPRSAPFGAIEAIGICILFFSLYMASGSIYLLLEGGARGENYISQVDPSLVKLLLVMCIMFFLIYCLMVVFVEDGKLSLLKNKALLCVLLFFLISAIGSENTLTSFGVASFLFSWYLFCISFSRRVEFNCIVKVSAICCLVLLFISIGVAIFLPSYGVSVGLHKGHWQGAFTHKNSFSYFVALCSVLVVCANFSRVFKGLVYLICVFSVYKSGSAATLGFMIFLPFLVLLWGIRFGQGRLSIFVSVGAVSVLCGFLVYLFSGINSGFLNNRGSIWNFVLSKFMELPLIGYGLHQYPDYAENHSEEVTTSIGFFVRSAHSGYVDSLFSFGVLAIPLMFFVFFQLFFRGMGLPGFLLGCLIFFMNFFESSLFSINLYFLLFILFVCGWSGSRDKRKVFVKLAR